jgi:muramoyltetrapeptide carboxypeptidase
MRQPPFLKQNCTLALVAPSSHVDASTVDLAVKVFQEWGLVVTQGKYVKTTWHQYAGTDAQRQEDLQTMLDSPDVDAICCLRGGYGMLRLLQGLSFKKFKKQPKWVLGFSDVTALHIVVQQLCSVQSVHSLMPINFSADYEQQKPLQKLRAMLFGTVDDYRFGSDNLNREGESTGLLTGGNLSVLYALMGTPYEPVTNNKVLFIEDVGEKYYHLDRMMTSLKLAGKLSKLKGLVVGGLTRMTEGADAFGMNAKEIIADAVAGYSYPVAFDVAAGHQKENYPLLLGSKIKLCVSKSSANLNFLHNGRA